MANYVLGVFLAIFTGIVNATASILQKKIINEMSGERREKKFFKSLIKNPLWILSIILVYGVGSASTMIAQLHIGGSLVPGLVSFGMIVLAIGSIKINKETLKISEIIGIMLLIASTFLIAYSHLDIPQEKVVLEQSLLIRIGIYSVILVTLWGIGIVIAKNLSGSIRGIANAIFAGLGFALVNLWTQPMMISMIAVFNGTFIGLELFFFIISVLILTIANFYAIAQTQVSYKFAAASKIQPLQSIPTQISPIIIFFIIYQLSATAIPILNLSLGIVLTITAGFLLAKRKESMQKSEHLDINTKDPKTVDLDMNKIETDQKNRD